MSGRRKLIMYICVQNWPIQIVVADIHQIPRQTPKKMAEKDQYCRLTSLIIPFVKHVRPDMSNATKVHEIESLFLPKTSCLLVACK